jgi:hypothetical protein
VGYNIEHQNTEITKLQHNLGEYMLKNCWKQYKCKIINILFSEINWCVCVCARARVRAACKCVAKITEHSGAQIFQKSRNQLAILGAKRVTSCFILSTHKYYAPLNKT